MSRSRKKLAISGVTCGNNTEYYREGNRKLRAVAKHILKNYMLGKINAYNIAFPTKLKDVHYTNWDSPTDGYIKFFIENDKELITKLKRK